MIIDTVCVGPMQVNCYIVASDEDTSAIIIDPGSEERKIRSALKRHNLKPGIVINTHGHFDHIGCDDKFGVPVYVHSLDQALLKDAKLNLSHFFALSYKVESKILTVEDGEIIAHDGIELLVLHIPGHTPGGIALKPIKPDESVVFTGDTLFWQGIGRSDLSGGDEALLVKSIREKLLSFPDKTIVYPGHGISSTIGEEKINNPYLA